MTPQVMQCAWHSLDWRRYIFTLSVRLSWFPAARADISCAGLAR